MVSSSGQLFDPSSLDSVSEGVVSEVLVDMTPVSVFPDVHGLKQDFTYLVPHALTANPKVGSIVRIDFHGRRVQGWITAIDVEVPRRVKLSEIKKISSVGPPPEIIELARWASKRWHGQLKNILNTASPNRFINKLVRNTSPIPKSTNPTSVLSQIVQKSFSNNGTNSVLVSPNSDLSAIISEAATFGRVLVVVPEISLAKKIVSKLNRSGVSAHYFDKNWNSGLFKSVVIGTSISVWSPVQDISSIIVVDEHSQLLRSQQSPNWNVSEVAIERAKRLNIPCLLVSPCLSAKSLYLSSAHHQIGRSEIINGWPKVTVIDRKDETSGKSNLFSASLIQTLKTSNSALLILNRKGRAQMLACESCGEIIKTVDGNHIMVESEGFLISKQTGEKRVRVCAECGGTTLKRIRPGIKTAAIDLSKILHRTVVDLSADDSSFKQSDFIVATESALFRNFSPEVICFLDFDQEILSQRYLAAERSIGLLVKAARMLGSRTTSGNELIIQTRSSNHRTIQALEKLDIAGLGDYELEFRKTLNFPPFAVLTQITGAGSTDYVSNLQKIEPGLQVMGPKEDKYLLRTNSYEDLEILLEKVGRPKARIRINVDPIDI